LNARMSLGLLGHILGTLNFTTLQYEVIASLEIYDNSGYTFFDMNYLPIGSYFIITDLTIQIVL